MGQAAVLQPRAALDWPDVLGDFEFLHTNGRSAAEAAIAAGMQVDDLYSICLFVEGVPRDELPVLWFKTRDGGLVQFRPQGDF